MAGRGFYGIGIENGKSRFNIGTLWRSAQIFNAAFIFTIGRRYKHQASDTTKAWRHIPLFAYEDFDQFMAAIPRETPLIGVELADKARPIELFVHPERAVYLLGAEDHGLSTTALEKAQQIVRLPGKFSLNVSTAGSLLMFDRMTKRAAMVVALAFCGLFAVACGDNPTSPTVIDLGSNGTHKTPAPVPPSPTGESTVNPPPLLNWWLQSGPLVQGTKLIWRVTVQNARKPFHIVTSSNHDDSSAGGGFIGRNGPNLRIDGMQRFNVGDWGEFTLTFDTLDYHCGRAQEDASRVWDDAQGGDENFLGYIYRYGLDCSAPPPPPPCQVDCEPPPPPHCVPGDPVCDPPPPHTYACMDPGVVINARVYNGGGTFTVTDGHTVVVSLVSFSKEDGIFLPQKFFARQFGPFGPGTHRMYLEPQWPHRQEDLFCDEYPEGVDLTEANVAFWDARVLAHDESLRDGR